MAKQYGFLPLLLSSLLLVEFSAFAQTPRDVPANYLSTAPINYVRTWDVVVPETNSSNLTTATTIDKARMTTQYLDGLGRPIQTVVKGGSLPSGSSAVDMVSAIEYDAFGREQFKYLPFASTTSSGLFKLDPFQQQKSFYEASGSPIAGQGETFFYGQTKYEASPLNRVEKTLAPGNSWVKDNKGVSAKYWINTAIDDVKIWDVYIDYNFWVQVSTESSGYQNVSYNWYGLPSTAATVALSYRPIGGGSWQSAHGSTSSPRNYNIPVGNYEYAIQVYFNDGRPSETIIYKKYTGIISYATNGSYGEGKLSKVVSIDENDKQIIEFKDKEGRVVLKKVQLTSTSDTGSGSGYEGWLCTYYLYDDFGNLRCVIQPEGVKSLAVNNWSLQVNNGVILKEQSFLYKYDGQGRMITKKIPGAGEVYMVYDQRDRLVMTQDANMRTGGKWMVTLYDELNRPIKTGLWEGNGSSFSTHLNNASLSAAYPFNIEPVSDWELLSQTGYDNYILLPSSSGLDGNFYTGHNSYFISSYNTAPLYAQPVEKSDATRGMVTWTLSKVLGSSQYLYTVFIYDDKGTGIQQKSKNISGGVDITTTQYNFNGQPLQTALTHQNGSQGYTVRTQYHYDALGRLSYSNKNINELGWKTTHSLQYDALGQLKTKNLSPDFNSGAGLETLQYDYNIRGWVLGMNKNYLSSSSSTSNYFGMELSYDKDGYSTTANKQYNGNIGANRWRSRGDGERRMYDFKYDAVNRLLKGDFTQQGDATVNFNVKMGDGEDPNLAYDANGNIKRMQQWGLKLASSPQIDDLLYEYYFNNLSNKLKSVTEQGSGTTVNNLGDFTDKNTSTDYGYDVNGNMVTDLNKKMGTATDVDLTTGGAIQYNHLNLPQIITVKKDDGTTTKGTINYTYDAGGNKLRKVTTEQGATVAYNNGNHTTDITTTTSYINGFVYESKTYTNGTLSPLAYNDQLQFFSHDEGRVRPKRDAGGSVTGFAYDYFIKDHLGNVRMVLTDEVKPPDAYPAASMETGNSSVEEALYANINTTRADLPSGYPSGSSTNQKLAKVNGSGNKIGPSIILKVMAGDNFNVQAESWYKTYGTSLQGPSSPLNDLITALSASLGGIGGGHSGASASALSSGTIVPASASDFLASQPYNSSKPKAYLNWILLDEQFKYVSTSSGADQVGDNEQPKQHQHIDLPITKNGYLYVYVSNETPNLDVFFDNLQVTHTRGAMLEETHYYPFGLTMHGISSKSAGGIENRMKYNEGTELNNDLGLEWYETKFRGIDPQLGRFMQIDPMADIYEHSSPYTYAENNPILLNDNLGLSPDTAWKPLQAVIVNTKKEREDKPKTIFEKFTSLESWVPFLGEYKDYKFENSNLSFSNWLKYSSTKPPTTELLAGTPPGLGFSKINPKDFYKLAKLIRGYIKKGNTPNGVKRVDIPKLDMNGNPIHGQKPHIHLEDGRAFNLDGTWKHGDGSLPSKIVKWMDELIKKI